MVFVGIAAVAASTAISYSANRKAEKAQKRQIEVQRQQAELQNIRAVREQVRSRYRQAAAITSAGAVGGVAGSSGVVGGVASLGSQMASNISYMSEQANLKGQEFDAAMSYAKSQTLAGYGQMMGNIGSAAFTMGSYFNEQPTPGTGKQ